MTTRHLAPVFGLALSASIGAGIGAQTTGCTGSLECQDYEDETGDALEVVIENRRADSVVIELVGGCAQAIYFEVDRYDEHYPGDTCGHSCSDLLEGDTACPQGCAGFENVRIEPGGSYEADWSGTLAYPDVLPIDCGSDDLVDHNCDHTVAVGDGSYEFTVYELVSPECPPDASEPDCACPAGQDFCDAEERGGTPTAITTSVDAPSGQVVIAIE